MYKQLQITNQYTVLYLQTEVHVHANLTRGLEITVFILWNSLINNRVHVAININCL